jgi:hypothetical protein
MTQRLGGATCILLAACTASTGGDADDKKAGDPVGVWKLTCVSPDGKPRECILTLAREASILKGTYKADGAVRSALDVVFSAGVLSFRIDGRFAGQKYILVYRGKPRGDSLSGTVRWSYGWATGTMPFRGERVVEQVASSP